ncbi:MAG: TraR/DksA family transcriptional regulator [Candidatus Binataceae bacterium]
MKTDDKRTEDLRKLLTRRRDEAMQRVQAIRRNQNDDALSTPGDTLDVAKSLTDVETRATLIERAETQLRGIDGALAQLEQGEYGVCANCGEEIPLARLEAVPSATLCVDCQNKLGRRAMPERELGRSAYAQWTPPAEADENRVLTDEGGPDADALSVRSEMGTERNHGQEEEYDEAPVTRRPGRPRKEHASN